jgi:hypothetical protein
LANWLSPKAARGARLYGGARMSRTTGGFGGSNPSADAELHYSLTIMRSRSRQMVRDSPYAKRAKLVIVNNVIGSGVGMQAQVMTVRDSLATRVNDDIEMAWAAWSRADSCHTGGALHFADLERAAMGQVFEAGEAFIRKHYRPFGASRVPLALELSESERLAHEYPVVALGSSGQWPTPGVDTWWDRMHEVLTVMCDPMGRPLCRLHGLRMLNPKVFSKLPLSSADSTNVGVNCNGKRWEGPYQPASTWQRAAVIADRVEAHNSADHWPASAIC